MKNIAALAMAFFLPSAFCVLPSMVQAQTDPLPSWNEGPAKLSIIRFVRTVTDPKSPQFVMPERRIAVFDNDGTLWSEQPMYFQLYFLRDQVLANPAWKNRRNVKPLMENDMQAVADAGKKGMLELIADTHSGLTTDAYAKLVRDWLATAKHPRFERPFTDLIFQPMLEVLAYLKANGFKTWIVSGSGMEFMRIVSENVYGIPPEQIIGSSIKTEFEIRNGNPVLILHPKIDFLDDKDGKPVGIHQHIGRKPIAAFGNSDGDLQMFQWIAADPGERLIVLVHHTDAEREYAYDRYSYFGKLDKALDEAQKRNWTVVDMKKDWNAIYPFQRR
jgi:phosphoglycolate phosphatase-like HAD superfamily hydrolase